MTFDEAIEAAHLQVQESEHVTTETGDCVRWCHGCSRRRQIASELQYGKPRQPTDAEVIADLRARLARAEAVVRDIADLGAPTKYDDGRPYCTACAADDGKHEESCPWRRAKEYAALAQHAGGMEGGT